MFEKWKTRRAIDALAIRDDRRARHPVAQVVEFPAVRDAQPQPEVWDNEPDWELERAKEKAEFEVAHADGPCGHIHCADAACMGALYESIDEAREPQVEYRQSLGLPEGQHACRHRVPSVDRVLPTPGPTVAYVGWDASLNTFFVQVGTPDVDNLTEIDFEGHPYFWAGTSWGEIPTLDALAETLSNKGGSYPLPWAELSPEMFDHLGAAQHAMPAPLRQRISFSSEGLAL